jgi:hypothetical protein
MPEVCPKTGDSAMPSTTTKRTTADKASTKTVGITPEAAFELGNKVLAEHEPDRGLAGITAQPASPAPNYTVHIQAMDAASFNDFARRNSAAFGAAVTAHIQGGGAQHLIDHVRAAL